jgi:hypothetical protein
MFKLFKKEKKKPKEFSDEELFAALLGNYFLLSFIDP